MRRIEFKVGQKVVALCSYHNNAHSVSKGKIYTISETWYCSVCGVQAIGFGWTALYNTKTCTNNHITPSSGIESYFASSRFAPLDNLSESIEEAVSNEDYELAQTLTEVAQEQLIQTLL